MIQGIYLRAQKEPNNDQMTVKVTLTHRGSREKVSGKALVDCGCGTTCIDRDYAKKLGWAVHDLKEPIKVLYADGRSTKEGTITQVCPLMVSVEGKTQAIDAYLTPLGRNKFYLGYDWLRKTNPLIDWEKKTINYRERPDQAKTEVHAASVEEERDVSGTPDYVKEFPMVFSEDEYQKLPPRRPWDHAIEIEKGKEGVTPRGKCYPLTRHERDLLDNFIDENLKSGRIRPSQSPYASPFFFRPKPGNEDELRGIQDYRGLNGITKSDRYPLPLISEVIADLRKAIWFTKMDLKWGFNNLRIKKGDEAKAAFITRRGLFEPLVMQFGLKNAPPTFQRMMDEIFKDELATGTVKVYIDDIIIFTETLEENRVMTRRVLTKLRDNSLYCRLKKCAFEKNEVEFLGLKIKDGQVDVSEKKVEAVVIEKPPTTRTGVRRFLGMVNQYRKFIKDYAKIARPLHELTGDKPFKWTEWTQKAFESLKTALVTRPVLSMLKDTGKLKIETDASDVATGAVLSQQQEDLQWKPLSYMSKTLGEAEVNYVTYDKEMLAIMRALEEWRGPLLGTTEPFEIHTDHRNLTYFRDPQKLTRRQVGWTARLQDYDFTIRHVSGKSNRVADALSRPNGEAPPKTDEKRVMLPEHLFVGSVEPEEEGNAPDFEEMMSKVHDSPSGGHMGFWRTLKAARREGLDEPGLAKKVKQYVKGCASCQKTKPWTGKKLAPLEPIPAGKGPWETISWDLIGPLPEAGGYNAICTIVDTNTKGVKFEPTHTDLTAEGAARIMCDRVYREEGLPTKVISDRGPQFTCAFMKELYERIGVKGNPSTAYHPQTDGQTERINREIERYLRTYVNYHQDDWHEWLGLGEFAINNADNEATGHTPFMLNKGRNPRAFYDSPVTERVPAVDEFLGKIAACRQHADNALRESKETMRRTFDKKRADAKAYQPGDKVYVSAEHLRSDRPSAKLDAKWRGPYEILENVGRAAHKLKMPDGWRGYNVFNRDRLKPYHPPEFDQQRRRDGASDPVLVENEEEWEVEAIHGERTRKRKREYLVRWKGYTAENDTWEPESNLKHAKEAIDAFKARGRASKRGGYSVRVFAQRTKPLTGQDNDNGNGNDNEGHQTTSDDPDATNNGTRHDTSTTVTRASRPGVIPMAAIQAMGQTWNALEQGITASRQELRHEVTTSQSEPCDLAPHQQTSAHGRTEQPRRPELDSARATDGTSHEADARITEASRIDCGDDARRPAPNATTPIPLGQAPAGASLVNTLYKRLMVVIQRIGRGDASVTDQHLARVMQRLRQHGLSVYIA